MKKHQAIGVLLAALLLITASTALSWVAGAWWHGPVAIGGGCLFVAAAFAAVAALSDWQ